MNDPAEVTALVDQCKPLLSGHSPDVQGAALADLLAIWLSGHVSRSGEKFTNELREALLRQHIEMVRELITINDGIRLLRMPSGGRA